jgi:putative endonuclease
MFLRAASGKLNLPPGIGRSGEAAAQKFVTQNLGYEIAETNFRTAEGEIDIVCKTDSGLIFFEVKTRTSKSFGFGVEQISPKKAARLQLTAQRYLAQIDANDIDWRIDLLSIEMSTSGRVNDIYHVEYAIEEQS